MMTTLIKLHKKAAKNLAA